MIDTHAHLDFSQFDNDREEVIQRAFFPEKSLQDLGARGLKKIINVGCNIERAREAIKLAEKYENIYVAVGIHPTDVTSEIKNQKSKIKYLEELKIMAQHPKVVAIGETGLDYFHMDSDERDARDIPDGEIKELKAKQKEMFIEQLKLARELDLPVIIHCRSSDESGDAYEDLLKFLPLPEGFPPLYGGGGQEGASKRGREFRGVIHCFSGNREHAKQFLDLGFCISFTGNITYPKKSDAEILQVVREVPLEKILIETDCPFLSPAPMRGKRNEPLFVKYVAEKIAEIKGIGVDEVEKVTDKNAEKLFEL